MITEPLEFLLSHYCHEDADPADLTTVLGRPELPDWIRPLHDDFAAAVRAGDLTPESIAVLTNRTFRDQAHLDTWLRRAWQGWFPGETYPA